MDEKFFNQVEFLKLCKANKVEPLITGDHRLVLICPKYPGKDIEEKFKTMIPEEVPWLFVEGLSQTTTAHIKYGLRTMGINKVVIHNLPGHRTVLDISHGLTNHPMLLGPSPLWDMVADLLKKDSFVETFAIRVNGQVIRDSSQYVGSSVSCPIEYVDHSFSEGDQTDTYQKATPSIVKDDRFDYERPFLPEDVVTDVKILLETTGSVEEFLKSI